MVVGTGDPAGRVAEESVEELFRSTELDSFSFSESESEELSDELSDELADEDTSASFLVSLTRVFCTDSTSESLSEELESLDESLKLEAADDETEAAFLVFVTLLVLLTLFVGWESLSRSESLDDDSSEDESLEALEESELGRGWFAGSSAESLSESLAEDAEEDETGVIMTFLAASMTDDFASSDSDPESESDSELESELELELEVSGSFFVATDLFAEAFLAGFFTSASDSLLEPLLESSLELLSESLLEALSETLSDALFLPRSICRVLIGAVVFSHSAKPCSELAASR